MKDQLNGEKTLLKIYLGESDKVGMQNTYWEIITRARKNGIAGATASRGVAGFGASSIIHEPHMFKLSSDLPIVVEIIDEKDKIDTFLKDIEPLLAGSLITEETVEVRRYSSKK